MNCPKCKNGMNEYENVHLGKYYVCSLLQCGVVVIMSKSGLKNKTIGWLNKKLGYGKREKSFEDLMEDLI